MTAERQRYLGILANVDDSILRVPFGPGFRVRKRRRGDVLRLVCDLDLLPDHHVHVTFEQQYHCIAEDGKSIYVVERDVRIPQPPPDAPEDARVQAWRQEWSVHEQLEQRIALLRLFSEGGIELVASYLYHPSPDGPDPNYAFLSTSETEDGIFSLSDEDLTRLPSFLAEQGLPESGSFLGLAYRTSCSPIPSRTSSLSISYS